MEKKKYALVTGASRGIRKAIAVQLAKDGFHLLLHYNKNLEQIQGVQRVIENIGSQSFLFQGDFNTTGGIQRFIESVEDHLAQTGTLLNTIVHNAGHATSSGFGEADFDEFDRFFNANVKAPNFITQALIEKIEDHGRIISISSGVTRIAFPHMMLYSMTKGAINTMTFTLAKEVGKRGITVNSVMPGIIDTDSTAGWLHTVEGQKNAAAMSALGREGQPERNYPDCFVSGQRTGKLYHRS